MQVPYSSAPVSHQQVKMMTNGFPVLSVIVVIVAIFFHSVVPSVSTRLISPFGSDDECSKIARKMIKLERVPCEDLVWDDLVELLIDADRECSDERWVLFDIYRLIFDYEDCNMLN